MSPGIGTHEVIGVFILNTARQVIGTKDILQYIEWGKREGKKSQPVEASVMVSEV